MLPRGFRFFHVSKMVLASDDRGPSWSPRWLLCKDVWVLERAGVTPCGHVLRAGAPLLLAQRPRKVAVLPVEGHPLPSWLKTAPSALLTSPVPPHPESGAGNICSEMRHTPSTSALTLCASRFAEGKPLKINKQVGFTKKLHHGANVVACWFSLRRQTFSAVLWAVHGRAMSLQPLERCQGDACWACTVRVNKGRASPGSLPGASLQQPRRDSQRQMSLGSPCDAHFVTASACCSLASHPAPS